MRLCALLSSAKLTATDNNQNISFLPAIVSTSTRMHGEFLRLLFLQAHRETEAHFTAAGMSSQRNHSDSFRFKRAALPPTPRTTTRMPPPTATASPALWSTERVCRRHTFSKALF